VIRPSIALTILLALAGCAGGEDTNSSIVVVNDGNVTGQLKVREKPPAAAAPIPAGVAPKVQESNACSMQDGAKLAIASISGIGTEPFWDARTEGRCVTYATPEDQAGTRVWTKASVTAGATEWIGVLRGKPFEMVVRPKADCSDGMSDRTYPMEVILSVDGEVLHGCAAPL